MPELQELAHEVSPLPGHSHTRCLLLQLMFSWLSTSAEGRQALALPYVGGRLLEHAARTVESLPFQGEPFPMWLPTLSWIVIPMLFAMGMLAVEIWCERKHIILSFARVGSPAEFVRGSATPALIFCAACDLAIHVPQFLSEETVPACCVQCHGAIRSAAAGRAAHGPKEWLKVLPWCTGVYRGDLMAQLCLMAKTGRLDPRLLPVMTARVNHLYLAVRHSPPALLGPTGSPSFWLGSRRTPFGTPCPSAGRRQLGKGRGVAPDATLCASGQTSGALHALDAVPDWRTAHVDCKEQLKNRPIEHVFDIDRFAVAPSCCTYWRVAGDEPVGSQGDRRPFNWGLACSSRKIQEEVQANCKIWAKECTIPYLDVMDAHVSLLHDHCKTACCNPV